MYGSISNNRAAGHANCIVLYVQVMRAVDRSHYVIDKAKAYSAVTQYVPCVPIYRDGRAKRWCCRLTEQGVSVPAPHIVRIPQNFSIVTEV